MAVGDRSDGRRPAEERANAEALARALRRLARDRGLVKELAAACGDPATAREFGDVHLWVRATEAGRRAAAAVIGVLGRRGLPAELGDWAVALWASGESRVPVAFPYLQHRIAPAFSLEKEPLTGQRQLVLRVPEKWSAERVSAWFRHVRSRLDAAVLRGRPMFERAPGGRPRKCTREEAIGLALDYDAVRAREEGVRGRRAAVRLKAWLHGFGRWLDGTGRADVGKATSLWTLHLESAWRQRKLVLTTLDHHTRAPRVLGLPRRTTGAS